MSLISTQKTRDEASRGQVDINVLKALLQNLKTQGEKKDPETASNITVLSSSALD